MIFQSVMGHLGKFAVMILIQFDGLEKKGDEEEEDGQLKGERSRSTYLVF